MDCVGLGREISEDEAEEVEYSGSRHPRLHEEL